MVRKRSTGRRKSLPRLPETGAMREGWSRHAPPVPISPAQAATLLAPALGTVGVTDLRPVAGGLVNTNLRAAFDRPPWVVMLRLVTRDPPQSVKEAALARLLDGRVPIARVLHAAEANPVTGTPYAVLDWIEGKRLDRAAAGAGPEAQRALGAAAGTALAHIHAFRFARHGFLASDLRVGPAIDLDGDALVAFLRACLVDGPGGARLGAALTSAVLDFAAREGSRLRDWLAPPCLVHGDFNPTNILVRDGRIAAVLDWEFALSATPAFDFGNLLRPPLGTEAAFVAGLARGYCDAGGTLPADWRRIASIADLFAWADLLGRRPSDPALAADARRVIAAAIG
jgi:aminoglycoside phosphotransferase (APT) family kinase protein